ncbi:MAG: HAD family hydrolase [Candidatus Diapherotrites archaeon]
MIKAVAFDVGDTLYSTGEIRYFDAFRLAEQKVLQRHGFHVPSDEYWACVEKTSREIQQKKYKGDPYKFPCVLLDFLGIQNEEIMKEIGAEFGKVHAEYSEKRGEKNEEAFTVIKKLSEKGILLGIISDTDTSWIRDRLNRNGSAKYFQIYSLSNEIGLGKGSGKPFEYFLQEIAKKGILPEECLMVGDLSVDMDAKKFGMKTALYNPAKNNHKHFTFQPDFVIIQFEELLKIVEESH